MKIEVVKDDILRCTLLRVSHRNETINWGAKAFERTELQKEADNLGSDIQEKDIFGLINLYWDKLSGAEQDDIFNLYKQIKEEMIESTSIETLTRTIRPLVGILVDRYHDQERMRYFIDYHGNIIIPEKVVEQMTFEEGSQITADKTYLREDYKKLVTLSVTLRIMVPIWGDFIDKIRDDRHPENEDFTDFKEFRAYKLLGESALIKSPAIEKLKSFIENKLPPIEEQTSIILKGLSSEDYVRWQLARVLVRRACIGDVRGHTPTANIIRFIHQFIDQRNNGSKKSGSSGIITDKFKKNEMGEDDNNLSRLEGYKTPEKISAGTIKKYNVYLRDYYQMAAARLCPTISCELVDECVMNSTVRMNLKVNRGILTIVEWVTGKLISPRAYDVTEKANRAIAIGVAQAILWHHGFKDIAAILTGTVSEEDNTLYIYDDLKVKIPKELQDELDRLYPFKRRIGNRTSGKLVNPAVFAIESIIGEIADREWKLNLSEKMLVESGLPVNGNSFIPTKNIKISIATAIVQFAQGDLNVAV